MLSEKERERILSGKLRGKRLMSWEARHLRSEYIRKYKDESVNELEKNISDYVKDLVYKYFIPEDLKDRFNNIDPEIFKGEYGYRIILDLGKILKDDECNVVISIATKIPIDLLDVNIGEKKLIAKNIGDAILTSDKFSKAEKMTLYSLFEEYYNKVQANQKVVNDAGNFAWGVSSWGQLYKKNVEFFDELWEYAKDQHKNDIPQDTGEIVDVSKADDFEQILHDLEISLGLV